MRSKPHIHSSREAGFSLVEGLMAAALLLVVAVSVLPLFMRALESNTRGGRASQVTTLTTSALEQINQATVDREDFKLEGTTSEVRETGTFYWDMGALYADGSPSKIGDERWVATDSGSNPLLWSRELDIRKYSFADVRDRSVATGGGELATLGDPRLLDRPLSTDDDGELYDAHLTEFRVHLVEQRAGTPVNSGQRLTIGHFRTF